MADWDHPQPDGLAGKHFQQKASTRPASTPELLRSPMP